jgi:Family of unknown function (DUF5681)
MSNGREENDERAELRRARRERAEAAGYDNGYAKAPEKYRFKKGHRPVRSSKPRKSRATRAERLVAIGAEKITMVENGRKRKVSRDEALDRSLYYDAMRGDSKARSELFKLWRELDAIVMARQVEHDNEPDYKKKLIDKIEEMAARYEASKNASPENEPGESK